MRKKPIHLKSANQLEKKTGQIEQDNHDHHSDNHDHDHKHGLKVHNHGHGHGGHGHHHHGSGSKKRLAIAFSLTAGFMVIEFIGGLMTGSLALLADAGHMVTDAASLGLGLFAAWISTSTPSPSKTFGYKRVEIIAAFINGLALFLLSFFIVTEALARLGAPPEVDTGPMLIIATIGLLINFVSMAVLMGGSKESLNVKGAFLHVLGDTLGSVAAIGAAIIMFFTGLYIVDAIASIALTLLILWSAWGIIRDSGNILLLSKPSHIDLDEVQEEIRKVPGVASLHDLHIFEITQNFPTITAHVQVEEGVDVQKWPDLTRNLQLLVKERFGINHCTFQLENERCDQEFICGPPKCNDCESTDCSNCTWIERWAEEGLLDPAQP